MSCFQALVVQGPVNSDYNGPQPAPPIVAIENVTITDCELGSPIAKGPAGQILAGPIANASTTRPTLPTSAAGCRMSA